MTSDLHTQMVDAAIASVGAGKPLAEVLGDVIALAEAEVPSPAWGALAATDTEADVASGTPWLVRQFQERPMADDVDGLLFGLYVVRSPVPGRTEAVVAMSGGAGFPEPAWLASQPWQTAGYVPALGLRALQPLTAEEDAEVRAVVAGPVVFAYALALVAAVLAGLDAPAVLGDRERMGVAVGVPGGETVVLGDLTSAGLDVSGLHRLDPAPTEDAPTP